MKAIAMAILVAELLWEPVLAVLMSMLVLVILEPLPHPYEPFVMTEMEQLAQTAATAPGLQVMVWAFLFELSWKCQ